MNDCCIVLCTCPLEQAASLAQSLVGERLAACVNTVDKVASTYRWQGEVQSDDEALLIIKTTEHAYARLHDRLLDLHPYDVPEIIRVAIHGGHGPYLDWLRAGVDP